MFVFIFIFYIYFLPISVLLQVYTSIGSFQIIDSEHSKNKQTSQLQ